MNNIIITNMDYLRFLNVPAAPTADDSLVNVLLFQPVKAVDGKSDLMTEIRLFFSCLLPTHQKHSKERNRPIRGRKSAMLEAEVKLHLFNTTCRKTS